MDGIQRSVITVNNTIPGPPIIAFEDQELVVHVTNHLLSDAVTIHWHGLHQRGTPFMDGVAYVTQCPINAGQMFAYRFQVSNINILHNFAYCSCKILIMFLLVINELLSVFSGTQMKEESCYLVSFAAVTKPVVSKHPPLTNVFSLRKAS